MLDFLKENIGTVIVALILIICITLVIIKLIRDKKRGKSSCPYDCSACGGCKNQQDK